MKKYSILQIVSVITLICFTFTQTAAASFTLCLYNSNCQFPGGGEGDMTGGAQTDNDANPGEGDPHPGGEEQDPGPKKDDQSDCNPSKEGDPILTKTGEFDYKCTDLHVPGRGMDVTIEHIYHSGFHANTQYGFGWGLNYHQRLMEIENGNVLIVSGDGRKEEYSYNSEVEYETLPGYIQTMLVNDTGVLYDPPSNLMDYLVKKPDGTWTITDKYKTVRHFNSNGTLSSITDRNGNQISFSYSATPQDIEGVSFFSQDGQRRIVARDYLLTKITDTLGREIDFTYNSDGLLTKIEDFNEREVTFTYDTDTNDLLVITKPATTEFPSGVTKNFTYNDRHKLETIKDARSLTYAQNTYDAQGRVTEQVFGEGSFEFDYETDTKVHVKDRNDHWTTYLFNPDGTTFAVKRWKPNTNPAYAFSTWFGYNSEMLTTSVTYADGSGIFYEYEDDSDDQRAHGNLTEIRRVEDTSAGEGPNDLVTTITWEPEFNQIDSLTDPEGNTYTFTYDSNNGNLLQIDFPEVDSETPTIEFDYNAYGQVTEVTDPNGNVTQYGYDANTGLLTSIRRDPSGIDAETTITYDDYGNPDEVTDPNGDVYDFDYNELKWLTQVTNPLGYVTKYTHDANGNVIEIERQVDDNPITTWQTVEMTYDILDNLKTVTDPLDRVTTYTYDSEENLVSVLDGEGNLTEYEYDERDLLVKVTDAKPTPGVTQYAYDDNGRLVTITDAEGNSTDYAYDGYGRLETQTFDDSTYSTYGYDKNSNLTSHATPGNGTITYIYDELNRRTDKQYSVNSSLNTSYEYDIGSRLERAVNNAADVTFDYDELNRVESTTQTLNSVDYTIDYEYYADSNLKKITYPSNKVVEYTYDDNDNMDLVKVDTSTLVDYDYDLLDRRIGKEFSATNNQKAVYSYDIADQLSSIINKVLPSTNIATYAYPSYDDAGNREQMQRTFQTDSTQTFNYGYNDIYELTAVSGAASHSYAYDKVGNRVTADTVSYDVNELNQYTDVGAAELTYDDNGNLTDDETNTYTYDEQNRLKTFTDGSTSASYTYDGFNRRVSKTVDSTTTYYVYDQDSVIAEYNGSASLNAEYVLGDMIDEVLTMDRNSTTYYYHYDGLGSVTELTNASGTVVENYTYDPYGNITSSLSSVGNPYYFTGRRLDAESGIYYYRARMYDPSIGRFLQRDPLGYWDGMNLFEYVGSNPVNFVDPLGLSLLSNYDGSLGGGPLNDFKGGGGGARMPNPRMQHYPWPARGGDRDLPGPGLGDTPPFPKRKDPGRGLPWPAENMDDYCDIYPEAPECDFTLPDDPSEDEKCKISPELCEDDNPSDPCDKQKEQ